MFCYGLGPKRSTFVFLLNMMFSFKKQISVSSQCIAQLIVDYFYIREPAETITSHLFNKDLSTVERCLQT
jgi:hypothetical protein